jgi:hypothetical protein
MPRRVSARCRKGFYDPAGRPGAEALKRRFGMLAHPTLEIPEHEFEDDDWQDDEEFGTDEEELELDEFDDIDEDEEEDI